jgi:FKBP-type peptidyl-prolyl cis-trans isomerase
MSTRITVVPFLILFALSTACSSDDSTGGDEVSLETDLDKFSYALGYQVGSQLKQNNFQINIEPFNTAILDQLSENDTTRMTAQDMALIIQTMSQRITMERETQGNTEAQANLTIAQAFLEENASNEGVVTLASGLQYKVLREGSGRSPGRDNKVKTHYRGTFIDGTEFDSSYKRGQPADFGVSGVISGWTEALQLMKEGSKWQLFVPPELAYGATQRGNIPPNSLLIFEVELIEILD